MLKYHIQLMILKGFYGISVPGFLKRGTIATAITDENDVDFEYSGMETLDHKNNKD